jgi:hypothetical protein
MYTNLFDRYRIFSRQYRLALSINQQELDQRRRLGLDHPLSLRLTPSTSESNFHDLWYIQRNRDPGINPVFGATESVAYTIQSCAAELFLDVGDPTARQRYEGVSVWTTPRQKLYSTQQWRINKYSAKSALGWAIESRIVGSVLDYSGQLLRPSRKFLPTDKRKGKLQRQTLCF